jgi:tRNA A-37 threonylcarbamoyl transferase component Bud32
MNKDDLKKIKYDDLKNIAKDMDIKIPKSKDELIDSMIKCFEEYEKYKKNKIDKYKKIKQLGEKGKEGVTYLVKTSKGKEYAMKTFKKNKSSSKLKKEAKLQEMASEEGISPKIVEIDTVSKYIVMERLDTHLLDVIKKQKKDITKSQQKQIISIFKGLDKAKVFHGDSNILNYMFKDKKLYIIDFGMSKEIDDKLIKKLGTDTPNLHLMNLGFILKLKELECLESSYSHLLTYVSDIEKEKFNL